jgi:hypothetical protein
VIRPALAVAALLAPAAPASAHAAPRLQRCGGALTIGATKVKVAWTQATPVATALVRGATLRLPAP